MSISQVDDERLVERAREGSTAAFGELVERHQQAAYRAAVAILGRHADAEDAVQDAFVTAYSRLGEFRGASSFRTWVLTITWRTALNHRRRLSWWVKRLVDPPQEPVSPHPSPESSATDMQRGAAMQTEIRRLSPKLRDALLLAAGGDCTYADLAVILGVPVGTVKWRVAEARRQVRARLEAQGHAF